MRTARHRAHRDAAVFTSLLIALVWAGSRAGRDLDPALGGYLSATIVASYGVAYRASAFWRRPASTIYARTLWTAVRTPRGTLAALRRGADDLVVQRFIGRRSRTRWLAHMLLSLGTLASFAITLPLVFGWMHFEASGQSRYVAYGLGIPLGAFDLTGPAAWLTFHALSLAGVAVGVGATTLLALRWREPSARGGLSLGHTGPLALLLAVALSGLALPATRTIPAAFDFASRLHEALVVLMLVALSASKLSHVLIRPLQVGARLMKASSQPRLRCDGCGNELATSAQMLAVEQLLAARGARFAGHQRSCPTCRRRQIARTQSHRVAGGFQPQIVDAQARRPRRAA